MILYMFMSIIITLDDIYPFGFSISDLQTQKKCLSNTVTAAQARQHTDASGDHIDEPCKGLVRRLYQMR
jgi:hypothetical protein